MNRLANRVLKFAAVAAVCGFAAEAQAAWQYYKAGEEGNPTTVSCITDGNWVVQVAGLDSKTGTITLGYKQFSCGLLAGEGTMDLCGTLVTVDGVDYDKKKFAVNAFQKYAGLVEFYCDNVTALGAGMFWTCSNLEYVEISGTATSIPDSPWDYQGTFASCGKLTTIKLDLPITYVGTKAFMSDGALEMDIAEVCPPAVTKVGNMAFFECVKLYGHLKFNNVISIGGQAFETCSALQEITLIGDQMTSTPGEIYGSNRGLFKNCSAVTNITMNCPNLHDVGTGTFRGLSNLNADIAEVCPPSVSSIGAYAYNSCAKFVGKLVLTNLHSIGTMAFQSTTGITEIHISGDIATLPDYDGTYNQSVFSKCGATNVVFETPGLTYLGNGSFNNASVKTITVNSTNAVSVGHHNNASGTPKFSAITIMGPAWTQASMDNMLLNIKAVDGAKACTIYVDPEKGWSGLLATDYTENEKANKPRKCLGVYVTAGGDRKAWVVNGVVRTGLKISFR